MIQGIVLLFSFVYVLVNLGVDLIYYNHHFDSFALVAS